MHDTHPEIAVTRFLIRGTRVWQSTYGSGTVIDLDRAHVRIEFDNHGSRLFARSIVKLFPVRAQTSDQTKLPAAAKPRRRR